MDVLSWDLQFTKMYVAACCLRSSWIMITTSLQFVIRVPWFREWRRQTQYCSEAQSSSWSVYTSNCTDAAVSHVRNLVLAWDHTHTTLRVISMYNFIHEWFYMQYYHRLCRSVGGWRWHFQGGRSNKYGLFIHVMIAWSLILRQVCNLLVCVDQVEWNLSKYAQPQVFGPRPTDRGKPLAKANRRGRAYVY